jgi:hypothetical protein
VYEEIADRHNRDGNLCLAAGIRGDTSHVHHDVGIATHEMGRTEPVNDERQPTFQWPDHFAPGAVRFAYSSAHYDATTAFYRDIVGLPVLAEFADSFGEDGMIFGLPSIQAHLEIVRSKRTGGDVNPLDQLVFYLSGPVAATAASAPLEAAGTKRDPSPHPYWVSRGATVYLDPDGRRVVFAPWVFGVEPEPNEHVHGSTPPS